MAFRSLKYAQLASSSSRLRIQSITMLSDFKSYPTRWQGKLLLACRKCQKKLKGRETRKLADMKKTMKRFNEKHPEHRLHIINVPCMDLCPKSGVAICDPAQVPARLSILRTNKGIENLCAGLQLRAERDE